MFSARSGTGAPRHRNFFSTPAMQALLMQILAVPLVLLISEILSSMTELQLTIATAALVQGAIAALLARLRGMAPWWLFIQLLFPFAVIVGIAFRLPSWIYLSAFLALLGLYWTTFRTQVPYYPSTLEVWKSVDALMPIGQPVRFVDIGSGFGGLVMHLAQSRGDGIFSGIEAAPLPWLVSMLRALVKRSAARFSCGDYASLNFADYDVVFAYLSPAAMPALWDKARAEMRHGALLLSYEFTVPGIEPQFVEHPAGKRAALYGWRF